MAATYSPDQLIGDTPVAKRNRVRLEIGDVDVSTPKSIRTRLDDTEIDYRLAQYAGDEVAASEQCGRDLLAKMSHLEVQTVGDQQDNRYRWLESRCKELKRSLALTAVPYAGGISVSDKQSAALEADRVPPAFVKGMLDAEDARQFPRGSAADDSDETA